MRNGVDLEITHGQFTAGIGKSGSGKSIPLNSIDGIEASVEIQRRKTMNRTRLLATGAILMFALATVAQQTTARPGGPEKGVSRDVSGGARSSGAQTVQGHLKVLTEKLDLTGDQQGKTKTILRELHDATQKLLRDGSLSHEERLGKMRVWRERADKKIREILNDDQKKKLDQLEQEPHPKLHGNLS